MDTDDREIESFSAAFQVLFPRAVRVARRIVGDPATAEDIAAETMTRALAHWPRIGGDTEYRAAWVARVAGNLAIDEIYGLIHISELGDRQLKTGDEVTVEIIDTDIPLQRMSLRLVNAA